MFFPRQVRLGCTLPPSHALAARVRGRPLLLLLWHRTTLDDPRLTVTGDRRAADAVLAAALTP